MKKITTKIKYGVLVCLASLLFLPACVDLNQDPIVDIAEGTFLRNEGDLPIFLNQLYTRYIVGHRANWNDGNWQPLGVIGSPIKYADIRSDNMVHSGNASGFMNGTFQSPQTGGGWEWGRTGPSGTDPSGARNLRAINYFLRNYRLAEASVTDPRSLDRWRGEALFFKALHYFEKVKFFGEVPWFRYDLNVDSPELLAPRTPRAELMDSVLWAITFAVDHIPCNGANPAGRINRDMALFLQARIALFEGTFRKYHSGHIDGVPNDYPRWLEIARDAALELTNSGRYELFNQGPDAYWRLFTFKNNPHADGNREAILARTYDGMSANTSTASQRYWAMNRLRQQVGATRNFIDAVLMHDGQPMVQSGTPGNFVYHDDFQGYDGLWPELNNRDPRLRQMIARPGEFITISGAWDNQSMNRNRYGITLPTIQATGTGAGLGTTVTGYWIIKHWMGCQVDFNATQAGRQTAIVFRYGEVLLMLAEAKYELGELTDAVLDKTINRLRERAGFNFTQFPQARLSHGNVPDDPRQDAIYAQLLDYSVSPMLREIRRERRVELFAEGQRYFDLMRWRAGNLLTVPLRGMRMCDELIELYRITRNPAPGSVEAGTNFNNIFNPQAVIGVDVFVDSDGFIIPFPNDPHVNQGQLPWSDYRYFRPIPIQELVLNPNLEQNPGWRTN